MSYKRIGQLCNLEEGITLTQKAINLTPEYSPVLPGYLTNLANHLTGQNGAHHVQVEDKA